jgi:ribonuclease J
MTSLTFYGGINEIGGNKILLEDKGTKVFLDFGMQMGKANQYFADFSNPRKLTGFGDMFEFNLLPNIKGIYRKDYSKHMGYGDHNEETSVDGVLLTHAHVDHCAYIHYLRPEIPIYCSDASKLIMQGFQDMGGGEEYITHKENFKSYENSKGGISRATTEKNRDEIPRNIQTINPSKVLEIDSISVESIPIDHSLPGVYGFLIHTSEGDIGYTADIRFHGRRPEESQKFVDKCGADNLDYLLCEGTRINKQDSITEFDVEGEVTKAINSAENLVVCTYPTRDLDRLLSFYNSVKGTGRDLVIDTKQAYLLKLFQNSDEWRHIYPSPTDSHIKVFVSRKSWGLLDKNRDVWPENLVQADYKGWEREFLDYPNYVDYRDIKANQNKFVFYCSDFQLLNLIDVRPEEKSSYIRSSTEPFNDEMKLDQERIKRWLIHFGLIKNDGAWNTIHVSGHGTGDQIKKVIDGANSKTVIPIHTEHEDHFDKLHNNVRKVRLDEKMELLK